MGSIYGPGLEVVIPIHSHPYPGSDQSDSHAYCKEAGKIDWMCVLEDPEVDFDTSHQIYVHTLLSPHKIHSSLPQRRNPTRFCI